MTFLEAMWGVLVFLLLMTSGLASLFGAFTGFMLMLDSFDRWNLSRWKTARCALLMIVSLIGFFLTISACNYVDGNSPKDPNRKEVIFIPMYFGS